MNILIKNTEIITVNNHDEIICGDLAISDSKIVGIKKIPKDFIPDKIILGDGFITMPGIINSHNHAGMTVLRSIADDLPLQTWLEEEIWPREGKLTAEDVYYATMHSIIEMIKSGTTSFLDMYFYEDYVAKAVDESGVRAALSLALIEGGLHDDSNFEKSISLIENFHKKGDGRITVMLGPHAPYTNSKEHLTEVAKVAEKYNVGVHIHIAESEHEFNMYSKQGQTPVEAVLETGLFNNHVAAAHCVHLTDGDIKILKDHNVSVLNNPTSNLKLGNGFARIKDLLEVGVNVSLGTDGVASNNNQNMFEEMHLAALINKGINKNPTVLDANQVLRMATINGAKALLIDDEVGSIEIGKTADVILINRNKTHLVPNNNTVSNLVYSAQASDVDTVIVNGQIIMEDRKILTINETKIINAVEEIANRIK